MTEALIICLTAALSANVQESEMHVNSPEDLPCVNAVELLARAPEFGTRVSGLAAYLYPKDHPKRLHMMLRYGWSTRSDTSDAAFVCFSEDNGAMWTEPQRRSTFEKTDDGTRRRSPGLPWVEPESGRIMQMILEGVLPSDDPLEGMKHWRLMYRWSEDGGRTWTEDKPVIAEGEEFTEERPLPGVHIGRNGVMIGDTTCVPIRLADGPILQPIQIMPAGPDGEYHNPGGGYTWTDGAVLIGEWAPDMDRIIWNVSERVAVSPEQSTRGMIEPTVAELPDGRVLMVLRGSNDKGQTLEAYRWYAVSEDQGRTWTDPQPWFYSGGERFYSPSSCSQLLEHSNGRIYWIGNISPENARGNQPRHPLVIGEVDPETLGLLKETICTIDKRRPDDPENILLSNFHANEDRETGEICVYLSPMNRGHKSRIAQENPEYDLTDRERLYTSDLFRYRISVPE